jgi:hypothetical protein
VSSWLKALMLKKAGSSLSAQLDQFLQVMDEWEIHVVRCQVCLDAFFCRLLCVKADGVERLLRIQAYPGIRQVALCFQKPTSYQISLGFHRVPFLLEPPWS